MRDIPSRGAILSIPVRNSPLANVGEAIVLTPYSIQFKPMEFSYAIDKMFNEVLPKLKHGNDGLIFTCRNSPYKFGTDEKM